MAILESTSKNYNTLINEITEGQVKIPQFQRQFVWDKASSAKLIDSIIKGYPVGTFIFWKTDEQLRAVRNIGNIQLPTQGSGEYVNYVLDGQQRITSIFAAIKGEKIKREDGKEEDFSEIFVDLEAPEDGDIVITDVSERKTKTYIRLLDLIEGDFETLGSYPKDKHAIIKNYQNVLKGYSFSVINLKGASIDVATEVFTRLNVGGKSLTLFEIMVAKTYEPTKNFDLAERYKQLCKELSERARYENIPTATVLQVVSVLLKKDIKRATILKLDKQQFIDTWETATDCIRKAVDWFRGYGVTVSRLLPYPSLLVPFAYFFHKHPLSPTGDMKKRLEDFFWRVSLGTRYSSAVESKMAQDIGKIDAILKNKLPKYEWAINIGWEELMKPTFGGFITSRSSIKAILCLYVMHKPKSFQTDQDVTVDNSWLKVSTSRNYHHFFPRAFMKKKFPAMNVLEYNHILNITVVDDHLNKNEIRAKAPSVYMKKFMRQNKNIEQTMRTHGIHIERYGVLRDDYYLFLKNRAKWVSKELGKKIIIQNTGIEEQIEDDYQQEPEDIEQYIYAEED